VSSQAIRVLLVGPSQGRYGGIESVMLAFAESLLHAPGFEPRLCFKLVQGASFSPELRAQCDNLGVSYEVVPRASLQLFKNLLWANVVHGQNTSPDIVFGTRLLLRPLLLTIYNHKQPGSSLRQRLWEAGVRAADVRCYISDFVRSTWETQGLLPGSHVMPAISRLPELPVNWQRSGFFFLSRWIPNKGIEPLLEAYASAKIDRERWPLTLAGDGPLHPWVESFLKQHPLPSVRLPGFVSESEKFRLLGSAKWNVAPPHTREDLGLTPIEARHLAVPSIITRDGGLPEAAGPHALVAEPGDVASLRSRLEEAVSMPEDEYHRRSLASQSQLAEFLRPITAYHALYRKLVEK